MAAILLGGALGAGLTALVAERWGESLDDVFFSGQAWRWATH